MASLAEFTKYEKMDKESAPAGEPKGALFIVSEKIHGANMTAVATPDGTVRYARRSGIIPEGEAFFEYQQLTPWLSPAVAEFCKKIAEAAESGGAVLQQVDVVGELYGGLWPGGAATCAAPVQSKPPIFYSPRLEFAAFDVAVTLEGRPRRYLDWPVARALLGQAGIPVAPEFGLFPRSEALHWPLPFDSAVAKHLGHPLPDDETRARSAEGVVVKCEVERSPVWRPVRLALATAAGLVGGGGADAERWLRLSRVTDASMDDDSPVGAGEEGPGEGDASVAAAAGVATPTGADASAAEASAGEIVTTGRGSKRWIAKVKCARFVETSSTKVTSAVPKPSKALKVPAAGIMVEVYRRLNDARAAAAQSKVGAPPAGADVRIMAAIGRATTVAGGAATATATGEGPGDGPSVAEEWALKMTGLIAEDLAEELGAEHAEAMGSCWRKPLDIDAVDAPLLVLAAARRAAEAGLPPVLAFAVAEPVLASIAVFAAPGPGSK